MSQANQITIFSDPNLLEEYFLLRTNRKVNHDATLSVETILYETDQTLSNSRVEVRYDPEWLSNPMRTIFLYRDGHKVGEARQVNFHDNSKVKRKRPGRPPGLSNQENLQTLPESTTPKVPIKRLCWINRYENKRPGNCFKYRSGYQKCSS